MKENAKEVILGLIAFVTVAAVLFSVFDVVSWLRGDSNTLSSLYYTVPVAIVGLAITFRFKEGYVRLLSILLPF